MVVLLLMSLRSASGSVYALARAHVIAWCLLIGYDWLAGRGLVLVRRWQSCRLVLFLKCFHSVFSERFSVL